MKLQGRFEVWAIDRVVPFEKNSKKHDAKQVAQIATSIERFGFDQPIVVDKNGVIIKGHGRRLACLKLGMKQVPVLVRDDLNPDQVRAARVADNRVAISDVDAMLLKEELAGLDLDELLSGIYDDKELEFLAADIGEIDMGALSLDIMADAQVSEAEQAQAAAAETDKPVPIARALGISAISSRDERLVAGFMARIKAEFKVESPVVAFMSFVRRYREQP
jgi:ParB-like chromosome segregation protein Spo0J